MKISHKHLDVQTQSSIAYIIDELILILDRPGSNHNSITYKLLVLEKNHLSLYLLFCKAEVVLATAS